MPTVHLLRHAKSSWDDERQIDHERPLSARGRATCRIVGAYLVEHEIRPELVLCSTARRTRETFDRLGPALSDSELLVEPALYVAGVSELLARLRELPPAVQTVMVIGHNPGLHGLALALARPGPARVELADKFPTGALATLSFAGPGWAALDRASVELTDFVRPRDLEHA